MYFEKNCQALERERRSQAAYQAILSQPLPEPQEGYLALFETDAGDYTLQYHNVFLHHASGASAEAKTICERENALNPGLRSNHIILGIGLGYVLDEVFRRSTGRIYIYEPNVDLLRFVLENVDLSEHFASQRVYLATSLSSLFAQIKSRYFFGEPVDVLVTQGYAALLAPEIPTLMDKLLVLAQEQQANKVIGLAYHLDWLEHFCRNLRHFPQTLPFSALVGRFPNCPAIVISSGPSLEDAIPTIREYQDRCILIAVGGALRPLLEAGITPDFAVFLDFQGPREQMHGLDTKNLQLICSPFADTACFTNPFKARYLASLDNYPSFSNWLDKVYVAAGAGEQERLSAGSTVSMMALQSALAFGCNSLIVVGQDLALRGKQYYAGSIDADLDEEGYVKLGASETMVARKVKLMEVPGQNGETLLSPADYYAYRQHLSDFAEEIHADSETGIKLFNASVGGAFIPGFEHKPLEAILENLSLSPLNKDTSEIKPTISLENVLQKTRDFLSCLEKALSQAKNTEASLKEYIEASKQTTVQETLQALANKIYASRQLFSRTLDEYPILEYALHQEIANLQDEFVFEPKNLEDIKKNIHADSRYFHGGVALIQDKLIPWVSKSVEALEALKQEAAIADSTTLV